MDFLSIFALVVVLVLLGSAVGGALVLGWLPGHLAAQRSHPQADAIRICGWLGLLTLGILLPVAFIWAFLKPVRVGVASASEASPDASRANGAEIAAELRALQDRLKAIETTLAHDNPAAKAG
jgi:hypothetical protein